MITCLFLACPIMAPDTHAAGTGEPDYKDERVRELNLPPASGGIGGIGRPS